MKYWMVLLFLLYETIEDIKYRSISLISLVIAGCTGIVWNWLIKENSAESVCGGIFMGLILVLVGIITKEALGIGDGAVFIITGIFLGGFVNLQLIIVSMIMGMLLGILLKIRKCDTKEIPFIPCILMAYLEVMVSAI